MAPNPGMPQQPAAEADPKVKPPPLDEEMFDVRAQIKALKGKRMTVYTPNRFFKPLLKVELAEDIAIDLDLDNYSVVAEGDKITAIGVRVAPKGVESLQVAIELATPLGIMGRRPKQPIGKRPGGRPPARGDKQQPLEVADDVKPGKPGPDGRAGDQEQPAEQGNSTAPAEPAERTKQILEMVRPKPEDAQGRPGLKISFGGGDQETFLPAKLQPVKPIRERVGRPEGVQSFSASLPVGKGGEQEDIVWQHWDYGSVKLLVDGEGTVQYFTEPKK